MGMIPPPLLERWPEESDEEWAMRLGWARERNWKSLERQRVAAPPIGTCVAFFATLVILVVCMVVSVVSGQ